MGGEAAVSHIEVADGVGARQGDVDGARVGHEHEVGPVEGTAVGQLDLAAAALLGGGAEQDN